MREDDPVSLQEDESVSLSLQNKPNRVREGGCSEPVIVEEA